MKKIGILTCSNTTQDLNCSYMECLKDFNQRGGTFQAYDANDSEIVGVINCAGCPTAVAPEKIISRVEPLVNSGADSIHFSTCLMALCPFKAKYKKVINEHFPEVALVEGTHEAPEEMIPMFKNDIKEMLTAHTPCMKDLDVKYKAMAEAQQ